MSVLSEASVAAKPNLSVANRRQRSSQCFSKLHGPPALSLDERGMIHDCSKSCEEFFGYERPDLIKHHVSNLFPQLTGVALVQEGNFNPVLNFICRCGQLFEAQNRHGETFPCNLFFVPIENNGRRTLRMIVSPAAGAAS